VQTNEGHRDFRFYILDFRLYTIRVDKDKLILDVIFYTKPELVTPFLMNRFRRRGRREKSN